MNRRVYKRLIWLGTGLSILGLVGIAPTLYFAYTHQGTVAAGRQVLPPEKAHIPATDTPAPAVSGRPVSISVPQAAISDLPVTDGHYNTRNKTWTLSNNRAHYAATSQPANNLAGLTFIYGHYRKEVFATLPRVRPGDQAIITTANGYRFTYRFREAFAVAPDDSRVLDYTAAPPILLLQTCSGAWFQNRQVFIFDFLQAEKL